jgi:hypothetical protein
VFTRLFDYQQKQQHAQSSGYPVKEEAVLAEVERGDFRDEWQAELDPLRRSIQPGRPYGSDAWYKETIPRLGLEGTIRPRESKIY